MITISYWALAAICLGLGAAAYGLGRWSAQSTPTSPRGWGVRPINEGCENCKYTDKAEDEEPCVRCRHTQPEGSARWTERSELWEEG